MAYTFKHGDRPLEDYTVQRGVGRGGFGEVYYAVSDGGREVALKYLRDNPDIELRGVSACMNLKSPHLVTVFDVKTSSDGEYFIVMEYVAGPSLRDLLLAEPNGLGTQKAAFFVREIARGLSYLHDRGIVHRDLKPGNIFYEDGYVKIGDYGLSKFISISRHSVQTASIGTVHYMAPEVGSGNYSRGVDIYALGVMLYEMLLGRVPFEGASMGEVLMKHLTEQPEVDQLPHPFGQAIRKALAKDPNDRYQTVDEMVEELFGVEDVKQSLAGFNPTSLSGVARHVMGDIAQSPVPSPNPQRPPIPPLGAPRYGGQAAPPPPPPGAHDPAMLGQRLSERIERIGRKLDKKLDKLDAKAGRPRRAQAPPGGPQAGPAARGQFGQMLGKADRVQRLILSGVMALGVAIGIGLVIGVTRGCEVDGILAGVSSFLMVGAISAGVLLSHWLRSSRMRTFDPKWVTRVILLGCCLPGMAVAATPLIAETGGKGVGVLAAVLIAVILADWTGRLRSGARGELHAGPAFKLGILAAVLTLPFDAADFLMMAGGVAAVASLSVQALGWAFPTLALAFPPARPGAAGGPARAAHRAPVGAPPWAAGPAQVEPAVPGAAVYAGSPASLADQGAPSGPPVSMGPPQRLRSSFARGFWSVVAFVLAGGTIVLFLLPFIMEFKTAAKWEHTAFGWETAKYRPDYEAYLGVVTGCVACFSFLIFALRKTTEQRRLGFWRETLRPFLTAVAMTGMGAAIAALAMPQIAEPDDEFAGVIVGLVFSSLLFVVLLFARGRPAATRHPQDDGPDPALQHAGPAPAVLDAQRRADTADPTRDESPTPEVQDARRASRRSIGPRRSGFTRVIWSLAAFLLAGGAISLFVVLLTTDLTTEDMRLVIDRATLSPDKHVYYHEQVNYRDRAERKIGFHEWYAGPVRNDQVDPTATVYLKRINKEGFMGAVAGCVACFSFLIFALRKRTERKRIGLWRETLRPLMMAMAMTGLGAAIAALALEMPGSDESFAGVVVGLVFSSLLFLVLLFARGRRRPPERFIAIAAQVGSGNACCPEPAAAETPPTENL
ncbi:MAG TPA: serine/threonine-protein kinase [Phycisphaerae bacterium]|nr:serine/threonine-protein kinase [Phycisphaerae bacterium]